MFEANRKAANYERTIRVLRSSRRSVSVSHKLDNVDVFVKIESKSNDQFDFDDIKKTINTVFNELDFSVATIMERTDALFVLLSEQYHDNKISITVTDNDGCGLTTNYYNSIPQQLIKI
jgi:hypothetical protein